MAYDDLRRSVVRISTIDAALGLVMTGVAIALGLAPIDLDWTVFAAIAVMGLGLGLLEPKLTGLPRREARELRRRILPRWHSTVYFGMLLIVAVLTFPGANSLTGIKFNIGIAICGMIGIHGLIVGLYNLTNQSRVAERVAVDAI